MSNPKDRIIDQVPLHLKENGAGFILFMQKYFDWLHRDSGFSNTEIEILRNDTSWLKSDVDKFIASRLLKYVDTKESDIVDRSIIELSNIQNPGQYSDALAQNILLEGEKSDYLTIDDEEFITADNVQLALQKFDNEMIQNWFNMMGAERPTFDKIISSSIDEVLFITLMKHINGIKGTEQSMRLFFSIYFNETIDIYQPKFDIAVIDGNWILDGTSVPRDDFKYNEYSYVIRLSGQLSNYEDIFNRIYLKNVHPAGFKVFLESTI